MYLIVGVCMVAAAIGLGVIAAMSGGPVRTPAAALDNIEAFYALAAHETAPAEPGSQQLAPLLVRARNVATRLSPSGSVAKIQHRLDVAGNPAGWTPERILAFKTIGMAGLALLGLVFGLGNVLHLVAFVAAGGALGFFIPDLLLYNTGSKRQIAIRKSLPDALDMLTVCVEAGLGFDAAVAQVARKTEGPMASEFARVLQEMQFGMSRVQALRAMVTRATAPELRTFVSALVQAAELGIPIAAVLREQAREMRLKRRQQAEEQAQKVPVKILVPLILFLMPALFIVILGPGAINIYHTFAGGNVGK
ncbi:MAG: tight adherence protein [Pseudonocardiales bacterium]|jgi:tight adherence protein C|nr:tight adherence protein [Pseudonocardiales bacterium]